MREIATTRSGGHLESERSGPAPGAPLPVQARFLLSLQRAAGNRAVTRVTQGIFAPVQRRSAQEVVVQRSPINRPPHNYTATNSNALFGTNHLAANEPEAETKSKNRRVGGKAPPSNTVLVGYTDAQIKALVLGAEYDDAVNLGHPVYGVVITCNHVVHDLQQGANDTRIKDTTGIVNGKVMIKVYFDETPREISLTGIEPGA